MELKTVSVPKFLVALLVAALCCGLACAALAPTSAQAKTVTKDGWYMGGLHPKSQGKVYTPEVWKITFTKTKVTTRGAIGYSKKKAFSSEMFRIQKNVKRTFRLSSKVGYYTGGGEDGLKRSSKKYFAWLAHRYNGLGLSFHVKHGKVVRMTISS